MGLFVWGFFVCFWLCCAACRILVPWPGTELQQRLNLGHSSEGAEWNSLVVVFFFLNHVFKKAENSPLRKLQWITWVFRCSSCLMNNKSLLLSKAVLWQSIYTPVKALSMGLATQVNWNQALKDTFCPCGEKVHGSGKRWHSRDPLTVLGPMDLGAVSSKSGWWALGNDIDIRHGPKHFFNMPFLLFQLSLFLFICFFNDLNLISLR